MPRRNDVRRGILIAGSSIAALALIAGGWLAARAFTSPAQWEAQAAPPKAEPVLAEVSRGDLIDQRTLGAAVVPSSQTTTILIPVSGAARSIVTESALSTGDAVSAGGVLLQVNGQPVFALASAFPFYRDLGVGDSGPDVLGLQRNLVELGLLSHADGDFGAATAKAVGLLYRRADAAAPTRIVDAAPSQGSPSTADGAGTASAPPSSNVYLPLSAVAAVPELPAVVSRVPAIGDDIAEQGSIAFAAADAVLRLSIDPSVAAALTPGSDADCAVGADTPAPCRVQRVFTATGKEAGLDGDQVMTWAELSPDSGATGSDRVGERATVRFDVATLTTDALLIPASALAQQSETSGTALKQRPDGSFRTVELKIVAALDGTVAVTGDVHAGDLLRVDR
ncbi:peptidoglycan hydrolase-like protein with peptidoglycan-binding domain [Microbacterium sp. W4I4]|uniref:hypothetical protein n=1 Tax=Microbacterium sp. W4I4 TaxID=3042295 RepID=UPI002785AC2B|nr:hypothetical protein [Microbacterium sp. W4I4]MDQ0613552.1 peptidoglycan hydrolase-like protein with peptidoglycan-binding domain [Microbacterium sp. W4I4]